MWWRSASVSFWNSHWDILPCLKNKTVITLDLTWIWNKPRGIALNRSLLAKIMLQTDQEITEINQIFGLTDNSQINANTCWNRIDPGAKQSSNRFCIIAVPFQVTLLWHWPKRKGLKWIGSKRLFDYFESGFVVNGNEELH